MTHEKLKLANDLAERLKKLKENRRFMLEVYGDRGDSAGVAC
jgi:hypothetical protein